MEQFSGEKPYPSSQVTGKHGRLLTVKKSPVESRTKQERVFEPGQYMVMIGGSSTGGLKTIFTGISQKN